MIYFRKDSGMAPTELLKCDACSTETHDAYHISTICGHGPEAAYRVSLARAINEAEDAAIMGEVGL